MRERPEKNMPPREDDPHATPLGRGANPGTSVEGGPIAGSGIAGQHGHQVPGERGGPAGMADRENEDAKTTARREK